MSDESFKVDSIVSSVITQFEKRAVFGKNKYGTDLDRKDLHFLEWVQHSQEELMDAILYLEKMKVTYNEHNKPNIVVNNETDVDKKFKNAIYKWCERNPESASKLLANIEKEDDEEDEEDDETLNTNKGINEINQNIFTTLNIHI